MYLSNRYGAEAFVPAAKVTSEGGSSPPIQKPHSEFQTKKKREIRTEKGDRDRQRERD
jgi:hypothetical protein